MNDKPQHQLLSMDTPLDGMIHRPVARWLALVLRVTPVTPNGLTVFSLVPAVLSAYELGRGEPWAAVMGLVWFYAWAVLDHADGELARLKKQTSDFGRTLDDICDHIASTIILTGIIWGCLGSVHPANRTPWVWALSFGMVLNIVAGTATLWFKRFHRIRAVVEGSVPQPFERAQKLLDHFTGREPFYILLFLYVAALSIGGDSVIWALWIVLLGLWCLAIGTLWAAIRLKSSGTKV